MQFFLFIQVVQTQETKEKKNFSVNGGNIHFEGQNLTVITFHGNNFKAKRWAVFSLNRPSLEFAAQTFFTTSTTIYLQL